MKKSVREPAKKKKRRARREPSKPLATVGIGASAGGFEAFKQMLAALPADTGMAFVFIQHLEARHESMLAKLLSSATTIPTTEVKSNTIVEPNHLYVIAPNTDLRLEKGVLHVVRRKGPRERHLPVDDFFQSLARDQGSRAIGIVLSGTASDGTFGLRSIRAEGGITFAQDPETAKFDGMPASAIMADCVDFILSPERIAKKLAEIARQPYVVSTPLQPNLEIAEGRDEEWLRLFRLLKAASGVDFTFYKKSTIRRRVARRMALHRCEKLGAYLKMLESDREETRALQEDLLIHVTNFFREPAVFSAFQSRILPKILKEKQPGEPVRIWVAGSSTGEEVYSLAICFFETLAKHGSGNPLQLFGTDVSESAIEKARSGIYPAGSMTEVSPARLQRFFTRIDGSYQINPSVRDVCVFARHDLTKDPPFSRLDVVSCRNVLIYLEPVLQKRVLASFHYALKDDAFLMLGKSETLGSYSDMFSIVDNKNKFFVRRPSAAVSYEFSPAFHEKLSPGTKQQKDKSPVFDLEREADRYVWERYAHAGLVVDDELHILQFRGDTSRYLRPMPGKATFQLLRMLREEFIVEVRSAILKARKTGTAVRHAVRLNSGRTPRDVQIEVLPLRGPLKAEKFFLILFEESARDEEERHPAPRKEKGGNRDGIKLQNELARTREYLQSIIQEQESTNEELKTANEEALSSMEELQSSNEELETAKEELQSTNEELTTLNEQLQIRNADLARTTDDLTNLLSSVNIPIVMLSADRRIRRFTPAAEKLLHFLPSDAGRALRSLRFGFDLPDLESQLAIVMAEGAEFAREVKAENGRWYSVRLFPFRTADHGIDGVLMAFVDIDELRHSQDAVKTEIDLTTAILDAATDLMVMVRDRDGRIVRFNRTCQALTGYSEEDVVGRHTWEFLVPRDSVTEARVAFAKALDGTPNRIELPWLTKDGQRLIISWSNTVTTTTTTTTTDVVEYVLDAGIDVTARREAVERAQEKDATVQALLESATQAIFAVDKQGRIVLANVAAEDMFGYTREQLLEVSADILLPKLKSSQSSADWPPNRRHESIARRKDGSQFPVEVSLSRIDTKEGMLQVSFVSDITERKDRETIVRSMTARLLSMQEHSGKTIARELHDGITQQLAGLSMKVGTLLKSNTALPDSVADPIRDLGLRIGTLGEDVHRMSRQLHPKILDDLGLEAALQEECFGLSKRLGFSVHFEADDLPRSIPEDIALCIFRVGQESLHNIAKHAYATRVEVSLRRAGREICLTVKDAGAGFDLDKARREGGLGLVSMEERIRLVGGKFTIHSQPGKGTRIEAQAPLPEKSQ
jgi:two-component system CheB/CheR fusion protein